MTVRIKFAKYGNLKFLSHLDVLRFFQKAVRRAGIDVTYSGGFHPHQIMSFAAPLGLGQTSEAEYFDMELNSMESEAQVLRDLDAQMPDGFKIIDVCLLPETGPNTKKESVMALVTASDYLVLRKDGYENGLTNEELYSKFIEFLAQKEIKTIKTTKTGDHEIDLRPLIYDFKTVSDLPEVSDLAEKYENGFKVWLFLSAGSENHIRPELVFRAFYDYMGLEFNAYEYQVHRLESYTGDRENLIPLYKLHRK